MGAFTDQLVVRIVEGDKPYEVYLACEFHSGHADSGLLLRCDPGFRFNGTSMPWGLRWLISPDDPQLLQCAAIHDKGFAAGVLIMRVEGVEIECPVHRDVINAFMAEAMLARGVVKWKRVVINTGLALGSGPTWRRYRALYKGVRTVTTA